MAEYVHPVLPPKPQLEKWEQLYFSNEENLDVLLIQAYQSGADYELDECCNTIEEFKWFVTPKFRLEQLVKVRRPKPPSLKEEAIFAIDSAIADGRLSPVVGDTVRKALDLIKEE